LDFESGGCWSSRDALIYLCPEKTRKEMKKKFLFNMLSNPRNFNLIKYYASSLAALVTQK